VSDPLRWWPGKYADCKRIAQLVEDLLPRGEVLECGGPGAFADLLPDFRVTTARIREGVDLCRLPWGDDSFDIGVSARVLELLPPRLRPCYVSELVRVCRYSVFVALPLQPELEAIDKIKNTYLWDTPRVWRYAGPRPDDIEAAVEGRVEHVTFHIEAPRGTELATGRPSEWVETLLHSPAAHGTELMPLIPTPEFVVAEIVKTEISARSLGVLSEAAH
jgi:hypothetical protein